MTQLHDHAQQYTQYYTKHHAQCCNALSQYKIRIFQCESLTVMTICLIIPAHTLISAFQFPPFVGVGIMSTVETTAAKVCDVQGTWNMHTSFACIK